MEIRFRDYKILPLDVLLFEDVFQLIEDNRPRLENYFAGTVSETKTIASTKLFCQEIEKRRIKKEYFPFVIMLSDTSELIGWIDLKNIDWKIPKGELGYFLDKNYTGKGIISEGLSLVIEHINDKYSFKKLLLRIGSDNPKSTGVALKNNFELEGTIRRDYKTTNGDLVDLQYYGKIF